MKIIKKPKIPPQTCRICGCVVHIKTKDLVASALDVVKDSFICPICCASNTVKFEKEPENEIESTDAEVYEDDT